MIETVTFTDLARVFAWGACIGFCCGFGGLLLLGWLLERRKRKREDAP